MFHYEKFSQIFPVGAGGAPRQAGHWGRLSSPVGLWTAWGWEEDQGNCQQCLKGCKKLLSVDQKSIPGDVLVEGDVRCWGGEAQARASNFHHSIKEKGLLKQRKTFS